MSRVINIVKAHIPLIKFPKRVKWAPNLNIETSVAARPTFVRATLKNQGKDTIEVFRVVPDRFRRRPIDIAELEYIQRGGPE